MEILNDADIQDFKEQGDLGPCGCHLSVFNCQHDFGLKAINYIDELRQQLAQREAEVAGLRSEISFVVEQAELRHKHIHAPEDPMIKDLCERIGYGAVMDSASRQWMYKDPKSGAFIQACYGLFKIALDNTQATAEAHDAKVREQAIRECMKMSEEIGCSNCADFEFKAVPLLSIEALLNKPESEGV